MSLPLVLSILFLTSVSGVLYMIPNNCTNCCGHWTYDEQDAWGELVCNTSATSGIPLPNYCKTGQFQSPVNINSWVIDPTLPPLTLTGYVANPNMTLTNNGHTIQATYTSGFLMNDNNGTKYQITQFHFHTHSEETVRGVGDIASMHLVHAKTPAPAPGFMSIAALGVLFVLGDRNPVLDSIIAAIPLIPSLGNATIINFPGFQATFDAMNNNYWNYPGSLTTPPCTEKLDWNVLATPWTMSQDQLDTLNAVLIKDANSSGFTSNYRRVQRTLSKVSYYPGNSNSTITSTGASSVVSSTSSSSSVGTSSMPNSTSPRNSTSSVSNILTPIISFVLLALFLVK